MAVVFGCAQDWTYDLFVEDAGLYRAKPIKGVHCPVDASVREKFMVWLKDWARDFKADWLKDHKFVYDRWDGYVGDAFSCALSEGLFSDFYKDTYGQRPHLPIWYYVTLTGLPTSEDTARTFCAEPVKDACERAEYVRNALKARG